MIRIASRIVGAVQMANARYGVGALIFVAAAMFAVLQPAIAGNASSVRERANDGVELSIMQSTQGNVGALGIGVGYVGGGPYFDEHGVRRNGLHAGLEISVRDKRSAYQQPDVHEGQTLEAAGYRVLIEKILPEDRGWVILRVWGPSQ